MNEEEPLNATPAAPATTDANITRRSGAPPGRSTPWVELRTRLRGQWVYRKMVGRVSDDATPGALVTVYERTGAPLGVGDYNPHSLIVVRMLDHGQASAVDARRTDAHNTFLQDTIDRAVRLRVDRLRLPDTTDAYRLIHAEGDGLSGLVVDRYGDVLSIDVFSLGMYRRIERIIPLLHERCGTRHHRVQVGSRVESLEGFRAKPIVSADLPPEVRIRENDVRFRVSFETGHKTGFFCDQRDNRLRLAQWCRGADVLDMCCYTGGFGLYAAVRGQAKSVTCIDLDEKAVAVAKRNANLNQVRINIKQDDAFTYMRQMQTNGRTYDVVALDPPKLVFGRNDEGDGRRKYHDLNRLAMTLVNRGGILLTCSCSGALSRAEFMDMLGGIGHRQGRPMQVLAETGAGPDHPVRTDAPEGAYLKAAFLRLG